MSYIKLGVNIRSIQRSKTKSKETFKRSTLPRSGKVCGSTGELIHGGTTRRRKRFLKISIID